MVVASVNTGMLLDIPQRPAELGRIRLGEKTANGAPRRLTTFRLTAGNQKLLEAAAALYGGKVTRWDGAPDEGFYQLTTAVAELDILIPTSIRSVSQAYELWQGGTCERRCDGNVESVSGKPCLCAAAGLAGADRLCEVMTRVSVMLPRLPGLGVWRLDTSGYQAATTIPATMDLLATLARGSWIPAVLRAEQRSKRERMPNGKVETHRFVVPVLDLPGTTLGQMVDASGLTPVGELEAGERPAVPTAAERAAAQVARIEAQSRGDVEPRTGAAGDGAKEVEQAAVRATAAAAPSPAETAAPAAARAQAEAVEPEAPGAEAILAGPVVVVGSGADAPGVTAGEMRDWLRENKVAIPYALDIARKRWGDTIKTLDSLSAAQLAQLQEDLI